ncbi:MAG: DUF6647 family protein [Tranquillimonas sp.]
MRRACRLGRYAAAAFWSFAPPAAAEPLRIVIAPVASPAPALDDVTEDLALWLDRNSGYARAPRPPVIRVVAPRALAGLDGLRPRMAQRARGRYDPATGTVYLIAPWSPRRTADLGVLLHELVHHRQAAARHWYCPAAQEPEAYALQARWLAARGAALRVDRLAVALAAGCTPSDIHPE